MLCRPPFSQTSFIYLSLYHPAGAIDRQENGGGPLGNSEPRSHYGEEPLPITASWCRHSHQGCVVTLNVNVEYYCPVPASRSDCAALTSKRVRRDFGEPIALAVIHADHSSKRMPCRGLLYRLRNAHPYRCEDKHGRNPRCAG